MGRWVGGDVENVDGFNLAPKKLILLQSSGLQELTDYCQRQPKTNNAYSGETLMMEAVA